MEKRHLPALYDFRFFLMFLCISISFFLASGVASAQNTNAPISEAPYIYLDRETYKAKWVRNNEMRSAESLTAEFLSMEFGLGVGPETFQKNRNLKPDFYQRYQNVSQIAVISDIHGQFPLMVILLKNHKIIDDNLNWNFGKGHLIINGDILGRGDMVTEILWLAYKLENQAEKAGGKLHYILGNHELMVQTNDFRYLNEKYVRAAAIMQIKTADLYADNSVLGNWLRKRPAIIKIDSLLITHAGISPQLVQMKLKAQKVNKLFYEKILNPKYTRNNKLTDFLNGRNGPVWYRGYFNANEVATAALDEILDHFESSKIIVGHTSLEAVTAMFGGRVIAVDSSIKTGRNGEILIIENGETFRGMMDGSRLKL